MCIFYMQLWAFRFFFFLRFKLYLKMRMPCRLSVFRHFGTLFGETQMITVSNLPPFIDKVLRVSLPPMTPLPRAFWFLMLLLTPPLLFLHDPCKGLSSSMNLSVILSLWCTHLRQWTDLKALLELQKALRCGVFLANCKYLIISSYVSPCIVFGLWKIFLHLV